MTDFDDDEPKLFPRRRFIDEVLALAERLAAEQHAAAPVCDAILAEPAAWWRQHVRKSAAARTAGMVRELLARMPALLASAPETALQVTALAREIADELESGEYPLITRILLRGEALRDHGAVLSYMGRYPEALAIAEQADALLEEFPVAEYDRARIGHLRALVLQNLGRLDEAAALARGAREVFLLYHDAARQADVHMTEGLIAYSAGALERALEIFLEVQKDPGLDAVRSVQAAHNVALCQGELRQTAPAIESLIRCIVQFEMLGMPAERTRSRAALGRTLLAAGKASEAIAVVRQARSEYMELGLVIEAAHAALDLAEALLGIGEPKEVPTLCQDIVVQFTRAGLAAPAVTALSFLREAAALGHASPALAREARVSLQHVCTTTPRFFARPALRVDEE